MQKIKFLTIVFSMFAIQIVSANECFYGQSFRFDDSQMIPHQVVYLKLEESVIEEFAFHTSNDEYITLSQQVPAIYAHNQKNIIKMIKQSKDIGDYHFSREIQNPTLGIIEYGQKGDPNYKILFIFDLKMNIFLGSIGVSGNMGILKNIKESLSINEKIECRQKILWDHYGKLSSRKINEKIKILFNLYSINSQDEKIKKELINQFEKKLKLINLAISNLN